MWEQLMKNQVLVSSVTGWVVAQFLKTIIGTSPCTVWSVTIRAM